MWDPRLGMNTEDRDYVGHPKIKVNTYTWMKNIHMDDEWFVVCYLIYITKSIQKSLNDIKQI